MKAFNPSGFIEQIAKDFRNGANFNNLKWVYEARIGNKETLINQMQQALTNPQLLANNGLNMREASQIMNRLNNIVDVGIR